MFSCHCKEKIQSFTDHSLFTSNSKAIRLYLINNFFYYRNTQYTTEITPEPWICGNVALYEKNFKYQKPMFTAQVIFRYPTVGRILFRQPRDEPWADTTILTEYLVHADGANLNNSAEHRWAIHDFPPGKDFYNWTGRCLSAGPVYNPHKVWKSNNRFFNIVKISYQSFKKTKNLCEVFPQFLSYSSHFVHSQTIFL